MKSLLYIFIALLLLAGNALAVDVLWLTDAAVEQDSILINLLVDRLGYSVDTMTGSAWEANQDTIDVYDLIIISGINNIYPQSLHYIEDNADTSHAGFVSLGGRTTSEPYDSLFDMRLADSVLPMASQQVFYKSQTSHWITAEELDSIFGYDAGYTVLGLYADNFYDIDTLMTLPGDSTYVLGALDAGGTNADNQTHSGGRNVFFGFMPGDCYNCRIGIGYCALTRFFLRSCAWAADDTANVYFDSIKYFGGADLRGEWLEIGTMNDSLDEASSWEVFSNNLRIGQDGDKLNYASWMHSFIGITDEALFLRWDTANYDVVSCEFVITYDTGVANDYGETLYEQEYKIAFTDITRSPFPTIALQDQGGAATDGNNWLNRWYFKSTETRWSEMAGRSDEDMNYSNPIWVLDHADTSVISMSGFTLTITIDTAIYRLLDGNSGFMLYIDSVYNTTDPDGHANNVEYMTEAAYEVARYKDPPYFKLELTPKSSTYTSVDSTPSVNLCYLAYHGAVTHDSLDGFTAGQRAEAIVLEADWDEYGGAEFIKGVRAADSTCLLFRYNSIDNWIDGDSAGGDEYDSLYAWAVDDTNDLWLTTSDSTYYNLINKTGTGWGVGTDVCPVTDSQLARIYTRSFSNNMQRRIPNFGDDSTRHWNVRYNMAWLNAEIPGTNGAYWDGIFLDNCGIGGEKCGRSDSTQVGGHINELGSARCGGELGTASDFHIALWADYRKYFALLHDSLAVYGKTFMANFAEASLVLTPSASGYTFYPMMIDSDTIPYSFWELDFKMNKAGDMASGVSDATGTITTQYDGVYYHWQRDSLAFETGGISIWDPRSTDTAYYGRSKWIYDNLAAYYVIRNPETLLKDHYGNGIATIGGAEDSLCWIDALGYDINGSVPDATCFANSNPAYNYAASVICTASILDEVGKDQRGQNWVVWRRDFSTVSMVLIRPRPSSGHLMGDDTYTPAFSLGGTFKRLAVDGTLGSAITQDSLRNGEGAIYMAYSAPASSGGKLMLKK